VPEQPELTPDPLAEKLGRFTPDASGFDRDALLFQAGRASVQPRRLWPALAGTLALAQAATLLFFLTRRPEPAQLPLVVVAPGPTAIDEVRPLPESPSGKPGGLAYRRAAMTGELDDLPPVQASDRPVVADTVLSVRSVSALLSVD
jgi:hypothetical protein